jgi:Domain of unknown function (DUF222)
MFDLEWPPQMEAALAHLAAAQQALAALDLAALSGDQLLELAAASETDTRQRASVQHAVVAELEARGVAAELGCSSTAVVLSERLRIGRREAAGRVRLAAELGPRRALSGERLPARFPEVASAVAEGAISDRHAALICRTITDLPEASLGHAEAVEATLVEHARAVNPDQLAVLTRTVRACLDPDGVLVSERDQERRRHTTLTMLPDGSGRLQACLTAEATAVWQTILDPRPPGPGQRHGGAGSAQPRTTSARRAARRRAAAPPRQRAARRRRGPGHRPGDADPGPAGKPHGSADDHARRVDQRTAGAADRRRGPHRARRDR